MKGNENKERDKFRGYCQCIIGVPTTLMNVSGQRGEADLLVWMPYGHVVITEWKQEGEEPRDNQEIKHARYRALGYDMQVFKTCRTAVSYINSLLNGLLEVHGGVK